MADERNNAPVPAAKDDPALDSLEQRIAAARSAEDQRQSQEHVPYPDARTGGMEIASTMVGYPLGGIVVGFGLDRFVFGTTPWITIGLMFLAFIAACFQVVRSNSNRVR